jgi:hypothetical protein
MHLSHASRHNLYGLGIALLFPVFLAALAAAVSVVVLLFFAAVKARPFSYLRFAPRLSAPPIHAVVINQHCSCHR